MPLIESKPQTKTAPAAAKQSIAATAAPRQNEVRQDIRALSAHAPSPLFARIFKSEIAYYSYSALND